jgi:uncharacterized protein
MRVLDGEQVLMRIFISEADMHQRRPLYLALLDLFREEKLAGATVLRGLAGFGAGSVLHSSNLLRLSNDLPVVIEVVDTQENLDRVMPQIDGMVIEGLITLEKARVVKYAPAGKRG